LHQHFSPAEAIESIALLSPLWRRRIRVRWRIVRWNRVKVWWRRRREPANTTSPFLHSRNLISLGIHALLIAEVVATLSFISINLAGVSARGSSHKKSAACTYCRTDARVSRGGP
jgi:hypothetical protein